MTKISQALLETMPDHHRGAHRQAASSGGGWGVYPHNGSVRRWVSPEEADAIVETDPDGYASVVKTREVHELLATTYTLQCPIWRARWASGVLPEHVAAELQDANDFEPGHRVIAESGPREGQEVDVDDISAAIQEATR